MSIFSHKNNIFHHKNNIFKTSWKPSEISDLTFWSDIELKNLSINNNNIYRWIDKSGNYHNAIQQNILKQPTLSTYNNFNTIYFQNNDLLQINLSLNYYTVITVAYTLDNDILYEFGTDITTNTGFYLSGDIPTIETAKNGNTSTSIKSYTNNWLSGNLKIITHKYNGFHTGHTLYINDNYIPMSNTNINNPGILNSTDIFNIGGKYDGTGGINGHLLELIIFNRNININEQHNIL